MFVAPYPGVRWLLRRGALPTSRGVALLTAAGIGVGGVTLLMLWQGLLGIPFQFGGIFIPYLLICAFGAWLWWRERNTALASISSDAEASPRLMSRAGAFIAIVVSVAALLNAVYWPFYKPDAVGIYADQAHFIYATNGLIPLDIPDYSYYQAYPMLVPLAYSFSYYAAGWENPYLAKVISTLLGLGCLGAVYALGVALYNRKTGWLALILLALTPLFGRWVSSGYADLPMAFYFVMGALFAWRTLQADHMVDALLSGIMIGLAAWTKNAMLPAVGLWVLWFGWAWFNKRVRRRALVSALAACALVAAPWYIRNLLGAGLLMPATVWSDQAGHTLANLAVFLTHPENFAFSGWLIVAAVVTVLYRVLRQPRHAPGEVLLLVLTVPFFAIWWLLASYDRRFILYFLPLLIVLAARWALQVWAFIPPSRRHLLQTVLVVGALVMTVYIVTISIDYKSAILRDPLMSDTAKLAVVRGAAEGE